MKKIFNFKTLLFIVSMWLFISISWKVALGVILFGWMMNLENDEKYNI
jgi:hypothetical protein